MATSERRTELGALTTLRFVAAALVVLHHSRGFFGSPVDLGGPFFLPEAVSFFFVLSGFILAYRYPSLDGGTVWPFLRARIARLWPAHLATLALLLVALPAPLWSANGVDPTVTWGTFLANVALVHDWIPHAAYYSGFNAVSWSLSAEWACSLLFPLLIHKLARTWHIKLAATVLLAAIAVLVTSLPHNPAISGIAYYHPVARLCDFMLGIVTALVFTTVRPRIAGISRRWVTLTEIAALAIAACFVANIAGWSAAAGGLPFVGTALMTWMRAAGICAPAFALVTLVFAFGQGALARLFAHPIGVWLGSLSYAVYLTHHLLIRIILAHPLLLTRFSGRLGYPLYWLTVLAVAAALSYAVERPGRRLLMRIRLDLFTARPAPVSQR